MNLDDITPVILTLNEEANIERCLDRLDWARRVVVLDSESSDRTRDLVASHPNAECFTRCFDTHAAQWNSGVSRAETDWVLCLDADYMLTSEWVEEVKKLDPAGETAAWETPFVYQIFGRNLRASLYPPRAILFDRRRCSYWDDGHTQRLRVSGRTGRLLSAIGHDDRKPLSTWFLSQQRYARLEAEKLLESEPAKLDRADRIRRMGGPAVLLTPLYCLVFKGLMFQGWAGWYYTMQRTLAELLLSLEILDKNLRR